MILAAGKGTRMKSSLPKVLHTIDGQSMINRIVQKVLSLFPENIIVVVGHQWERVRAEVESRYSGKVAYAIQRELRGTGDAVRSGICKLHESTAHLLILCGDVPLIETDTLQSFVKMHIHEGYDITVLSTVVENPTGYGRIILDDNSKVVGIREESDASPEEKKIQIINSGVYCVKVPFLKGALLSIRPDNEQGEFYLTDLVAIARNQSAQVGLFELDRPDELMGVNNIEQLKTAENLVNSGER